MFKDFLQRANGSVYLCRCNILKGSKPLDFVIVNPSGKNYVLTALNETDQQEWIEAISKLTEVEARALNYTAGQVIEKRGLLNIKGKMKWFVLKEGALMWFSSEADPTLEGSTTLASATVALGTTATGPGFIVATVDNKYICGCKTREEAEEWSSYMRAAINAAKHREIMQQQPPQRDALTLSHESDVGSGSSRNASDMYASGGGGGGGGVGGAGSGIYSLSGTLTSSSGNAAEGGAAPGEVVELEEVTLRRGWMHLPEQGGTVYCMFHGTTVVWSNQEMEVSPASIKKHMKGFLALTAEHTVHVSVNLRSVSSDTLYGIDIRGGGNLLQLYPSSAEERDDLLHCVRGALLALGQRRHHGVSEKEGWMLRGRMKKWVVVRDGLMLIHERQSAKPTQTLALEGCSVICSYFLDRADHFILLLQASGESELLEVLTEKKQDPLVTKRDMAEWLQAISNNCFSDDGAPLEEGNEEQEGRFREQQRNGWVTCLSGKQKKKSELFFSLRHHSLLWYKSDHLVDLKGSTLLCGCRPVLEEKRISLYGSDEKLIIAFETAEVEEATSWAVALQEAVIDADEARGYLRFGWLDRKGKRKWIALTKKQIFWFNTPQRLEQLRSANVIAGAATGIGCLNMAECDVTTQGECGIVITQRMTKKFGPGETMNVEVFTAESNYEQGEWIKALQGAVGGSAPRTNFDGIPYGSLRIAGFMADPIVALQLEGMNVLEEGETEKASIVSLPSAGSMITLYQPDGTPIVEPNTPITQGITIQLGFDVARLQEPTPLPPVEETFVFLLRTANWQVENTARILVRRATGQEIGGAASGRLRSHSNALGSQQRASTLVERKSDTPPRRSGQSPRSSVVAASVAPAAGRHIVKELPTPPAGHNKELPPLPTTPKKELPALPPKRVAKSGGGGGLVGDVEGVRGSRSPRATSVDETNNGGVGARSPRATMTMTTTTTVDDTPADVLIEVLLFQKAKRQHKGGERWVDVVEDLTKVQTPQAIQARRNLLELVLGHESAGVDESVVVAILQSIPSTEADMMVQSIVNLYASSSEGLLIPLIKSFIREEVRSAAKAETLFRVNSSATKMMKFFSDIAGNQFLRDTLSDPVKHILSFPPNACEVDPEKLGSEDDVAELLEIHGAALIEACQLVLSAIYASLERMPPEFCEICDCLWSEVSAKFPDAAHTAVAGFLFLRFFCPAIVAPEGQGVGMAAAGKKATVSRDQRRALTLVAKVLQQLANGVDFGKKEEFMTPFNEYLHEELPNVQSFLEQATQVSSTTVSSQELSPVPRSVVERSIDNIYKQLLLQRKKLQANHPKVFQNLTPILRAIGIPDKLRRALAAQGQGSKE